MARHGREHTRLRASGSNEDEDAEDGSLHNTL